MAVCYKVIDLPCRYTIKNKHHNKVYNARNEWQGRRKGGGGGGGWV